MKKSVTLEHVLMGLRCNVQIDACFFQISKSLPLVVHILSHATFTSATFTSLHACVRRYALADASANRKCKIHFVLATVYIAYI